MVFKLYVRKLKLRSSNFMFTNVKMVIARVIIVVGIMTDIVLRSGAPLILNKLDEKESGIKNIVTYVKSRISSVDWELVRAV